MTRSVLGAVLLAVCGSPFLTPAAVLRSLHALHPAPPLAATADPAAEAAAAAARRGAEFLAAVPAQQRPLVPYLARSKIPRIHRRAKPGGRPPSIAGFAGSDLAAAVRTAPWHGRREGMQGLLDHLAAPRLPAWTHKGLHNGAGNAHVCPALQADGAQQASGRAPVAGGAPQAASTGAVSGGCGRASKASACRGLQNSWHASRAQTSQLARR